MSDDPMKGPLEQARKMLERERRELAETTAEASSGDGKVTARMNGHRALVSIHIEPELLSADALGTLEDTVRDVVNEVTAEINEIRRDRFGIRTEMPSFDIESFLR